MTSAERIIGKHHKIRLESDPPPDIVVEIDVTNESLGKFGIYAALGVPEIWRYDGTEMQFVELVDHVSPATAGLRPLAARAIPARPSRPALPALPALPGLPVPSTNVAVAGGGDHLAQ